MTKPEAKFSARRSPAKAASMPLPARKAEAIRRKDQQAAAGLSGNQCTAGCCRPPTRRQTPN
jgi:hypothetical protein